MPEFKETNIFMHFDNPALRFVLGSALVAASALGGMSRQASAQQGKRLSYPQMACAPNPLVVPDDVAVQKDMKGWHTILETCEQPVAKGYAISAIIDAKDPKQTNYLIDRYAFEMEHDGAPNVVKGLRVAIEKQAALTPGNPETAQRLEDVRRYEQQSLAAYKQSLMNPDMPSVEISKRQTEINELGQLIVRIAPMGSAPAQTVAPPAPPPIQTQPPARIVRQPPQPKS